MLNSCLEGRIEEMDLPTSIFVGILFLAASILSALSFQFKHTALCYVTAVLWVLLGFQALTESNWSVTEFNGMLGLFCLAVSILMGFSPIIMREKKSEGHPTETRSQYLNRKTKELRDSRNYHRGND